MVKNNRKEKWSTKFRTKQSNRFSHLSARSHFVHLDSLIIEDVWLIIIIKTLFLNNVRFWTNEGTYDQLDRITSDYAILFRIQLATRKLISSPNILTTDKASIRGREREREQCRIITSTSKPHTNMNFPIQYNAIFSILR